MEEENKTDVTEQPVEAAETARQKALRRARARNSERQFADDDDEALWGAMNEDSEADEEELGRYRKNSEDFNKFLQSDPKSLSFMSRWRRDGSPIAGLVSEYGEDIVADITNPDNQEMVAEAQKEYLERIAKSKELDEMYEANVNESRQVKQDMIDEGTYSEEEINEAVRAIGKDFEDFLVGKISRDAIEVKILGMKYDADVAQAGEKGEVRGRNQNIQREFEARRKRGDGLPSLPGSSNGNERRRGGEENVGGALGKMGGRRQMW